MGKGESTIKDASANLIRVLFMEHLGKHIKICNLVPALDENDEPTEEKHIFTASRGSAGKVTWSYLNKGGPGDLFLTGQF